MQRADYLGYLQALLPPGAAWPRSAEATLTRLLDAWAAELSRLDASLDTLIAAANPQDAGPLLAEWLTLSNTSSHGELLGLLAAVGGQTPAYFQALAQRLGLEIDITAGGEAFAVDSASDDTLFPPCSEHFRANSPCQLTVQGWLTPFAWWVTVRAGQHSDNLELQPLRANASCNQRLTYPHSPTLEALFQRFKPAHTRPIFCYA